MRGLLSAMSRVYGRAVARRNARFDRGEGVVTLDRPVVSVGNLSVGGTGKTPTVAWAVGVLREAGFWPAVAMRGYGSSRTEGGLSDEAEEYRARLADLPVVAQPNRTAGLIDLFATDAGERVDAVVLDDGFQHRQLARQVDIVLVDCTRSPFEDALLPAGRLRESLASLARAHAVVLTHAEAVSAAVVAEIRRAITEVKREMVVAEAEHAWAGLEVTGIGKVGLEWLAGKRVLAVSAIGNPGPFEAEVARRAGSVAGTVRLRDHDPYAERTVARVLREARGSGAEAVVCTAKDWSKLARVKAGRWPCPVARPALEMRFRGGGEELAGLVVRAASAGAE